jgi:hypothetical protein
MLMAMLINSLLRARATSAAPTWFSSYYHRATGTTYLDGGLYNNNPINIVDHERKLLWPNSQVDITVSIGTGYDPFAKPKKTTPEAPNIVSRAKDLVLGLLDKASPLIRLATIACDHVENSLDSQRTWEEYQQRSKAKKELSFRLNTALQGPIPELDEVNKIPNLIEEAQIFWSLPENNDTLRDLAQKLVASSFYFKSISGPTSTDEGNFSVQGNYPENLSLTRKLMLELGEINCRFPASSERQEIRYLAEHFESGPTTSGGFPCFRTQEQGIAGQKSFPISSKVLQLMRSENKFVLTTEPINFFVSSRSSMVEISLYFGPRTPQPISGFPRRFTSKQR